LGFGWLCWRLGPAFRPAVGYYGKVEHDRHCGDSGSHERFNIVRPKSTESLAGDSRAHNTNPWVRNRRDRPLSVELIGCERRPSAGAEMERAVATTALSDVEAV
jgi:hypothetical protein